MSTPVRTEARSVKRAVALNRPLLVSNLRCEISPQFRLLHFSENARQLLGLDPKTLLKDSSLWKSQLHPDDISKLSRLRSVMESDGKGSIDCRWRHHDGDYRKFHVEVALVQLRRQSHPTVIGCFAEVTRTRETRKVAAACERELSQVLSIETEGLKAASQEPMEHDNLLRLLVERSPIPMAVIRFDGFVEYLNPTFTSAFGYQSGVANDLISWMEIMLPDHSSIGEARAFWQQEVIPAAQTGRAVPSRTWRIRDAKGNLRSVHIRGSAVSGRVLAVFEDVTLWERQRQEFQTLFDSSPDEIYVARSGRIVAANQTACRALGWTLDRLIGKELADVNPVLTDKQIAQVLRQSAPGEAATVLGRQRRKDGSEYPVEVRLTHFEFEGLPAFLVTVRDVTSRTQSEAKLRESERRFRELFEAQRDMIYVANAEGRIVEANQATLEKLGYSREELLALRHTDLQTDLPMDLRVQSRRDAIAGRPNTLRSRYTRNDGTSFAAEIQINPITISGEPLAMATVRDTTERDQAEAALQASEARLRRVTQHTPTILLELDLDGCIRFVSKAFAGLEPEYLTGRRLGDVPLDPALLQGFAECVRAKSSLSVEFLQSDSDGAVRTVLCQFSPVMDNQNLKGVILSATDITERKALDEALTRRTAALEHTSDGIVMLQANAANRPIIFADSSFQKLTGFSFDEIRGKDCQEILCGNDTDKGLQQKIQSCLQTGYPFSGEVQLRQRDGAYFWAHLRLVPLRDEAQKLSSFVGLILDISVEKQSRLELDQQREKLAELGRLAALGEVSVAFAHELAHPLCSITGNAAAILDASQKCPHQQCGSQEIVEDILRDVSRMREVFDRILSLARPDRRVRHWVNINNLVRNTVRLALQNAEARKVQLRVHLTQRSPMIWADLVQIQQVLLNLLNNALDAVESVEPPRRLVELTTKNLNGTGVIITVRDQGMGIPPDLLDKSRKAFFSTKANGIGIGLRLCRSLVEAHQGTLIARNNADHGASFLVTLPVGRAPSE